MTHVTHRSDESKGVGKVTDHTITNEGVINFYTVEWADGTTDKDISAEQLLEVKSHKH